LPKSIPSCPVMYDAEETRPPQAPGASISYVDEG
jgi:hypothetical protein